MRLAHVFNRYNKDFPLIELIEDYQEIQGDAKKYFLCPCPVSFVLPDNRCFIGNMSDIVVVDIEKAIGRLGNSYKVPADALFPVISRKEG